MAKIIWSETSLNDLKNIADYIKKDSSYNAQKFINELINQTKKLELFPNSGKKSKLFYTEYLREIIYKNYRIFYHFEGEIVYILSIVHSMRDK